MPVTLLRCAENGRADGSNSGGVLRLTELQGRCDWLLIAYRLANENA